MDERIKYRLGEGTAANSNNVDSYMKVEMVNNESTLPVGDMNHIVDVGERFNKERQEGTYYRFSATIRPLMSNPLFNISGSDSWDSFNTYNFRNQTYPAMGPTDNGINDEEDLTFKESVTRHLKEIDGWFGYYSPNTFSDGLCNFIDMEPKRRRLSFTKDRFNLDGNGDPSDPSDLGEPVRNWEITLTYPSSSADTALTTGGLLMFDKRAVEVGKRVMTAIGIPVLHNLEQSDIVRITGTNYDGDYDVKRIGLDNGDLRGYYFVIDVDPTLFLIGNNSRIKKVVGGQESVYYFRIFEKIKTRVKPRMENDDYEIYPLSFANNIYNDDVSQMIVNEDIDVSDLTDNLGRPISEIYMTIIKTKGNQLSGGFNGFTNVKSGVEVPYMPDVQATSGGDAYKVDIPDIRRIHDGFTNPTLSHTPLENNVTIASNSFYGDVVEYNKFKVSETILGEINHRFNTANRVGSGTSVATGPRQEGYYYKAHYPYIVRNFSAYIEQGDLSTAGIPDYAEDLGDGRWLWRDFLSIGFNEGQDNPVNYPFLNGAHYLHKNLCFTLKRQDPFGFFGLYYSQITSADPAGDPMGDNFTTNFVQNVC